MPLYARGSITVEEEDGNPTVANVTKIQVPNTSLTNDSGTIVSLSYALASGTPTFVGAKGTNTAGTSINTATPTAVPFATEEFDTSAFHDTSSNNTRLVVPSGKDGYYIVQGQATFAVANLAGTYALIRKNGTTDLAFMGRFGGETAGVAGHSLVALVNLAATDYVELIVNQSSGSARALETTAGYNWLALTLLGA